MEDYYAHRNSGHRYQIKKVDDDGDIQLIDGDGMTGESHTKIMRVFPHGFSSHSPDDSHMLAIGLGGRRDLLVALGGEHHEKRARKVEKGDTILYNAEGDAIRVFKKSMDVVHAKNIKLSIGNGVKSGEGTPGEDKDVTIVMTDKDITITKGESSVKLEADKITAKRGESTMVLEAAKITHKSPKVVIESDHVDLGAEGGQPIGLCGGGCATKVFAV